MHTRRYPRTLQEAFGPYTSNRIDEPAAAASRELETCAVVAVVLVALIGAVAAVWGG